MSKEYEIHSITDFEKMIKVHTDYFKKRELQGKKFLPFRIISKRMSRKKTSAQHRTFWRCIGEMKKAFYEVGYVVNDQEVSEFVKRQAGFTKMIHGELITLSIADKSDHATIESLKMLIDFMVQFAATKLNYEIKIGEDLID